MSAEVGEMPETHAEESVIPEKLLSQTSHQSNVNLVIENGFSGNGLLSDDDHEELTHTVMELKVQNEFLMSQFADLKHSQLEMHESQEPNKLESENRESGDVMELKEVISYLKRELHEEKLTKGAAEEAMRHLREAFSEADAKAQDLSAKLAEAQQNLDNKIKESDEKCSDLESKLQRLHKRAKQRIQEVQKEKDDLEAKLRDMSGTAERASSQHIALQQELERSRQQANEALKAMDAERQQLRSANNKLRDNIEELRRSLQPKEQALESLQQTILEKEQMLEDMRGLLQSADEKRLASLDELSAKHRKNIESLEAQLADEVADRKKAAETISSLQVLAAEKESKIAEMDAASSGEAARLKASLEALKGDLAHVKHEHEKENESWEAAFQALKAKLEFSESNCIRTEIEAAKIRSHLESEVSVKTQMVHTRDAELLTAKEEIKRLESEFSSYKARAHALLQKKDAELAGAMESEQVQALVEALNEAEKELALVSEEKDRALQDLKESVSCHYKELANRDSALHDAKKHIKGMETKLDFLSAQHQSEKEAWEINLKNTEESWRFRCEALKSENESFSGQGLQREIEELMLEHKKLKEEHNSFRNLADRMIEEKDKEISKLLDDNKNLHRSLELRSLAGQNDSYNSVSAMQKQDALNLSTSSAEQQILILARQQAQREEELAQSQRHILALQEEIEELEHENRLHSQQEALLKGELRNLERSQKREGVDMTYLKNVILKLLETGEVEALLPVVAMLLQFSPDEVQKCQQAYRAMSEVPASPASDASGSTRSLLSRFTFS